jgi:BirA family biotin operon repressor/biotin-[acetyl-CoA-carboxylase] ligase
VALADALDPLHETQAPRLLLKWPNDLWLQDAQAPFGGRKLGGVLIETASAKGARWCVVGVGLNVRPLPAQITQDFTTGMAALQELDPTWEALEALMRVAPAVAGAMATFEQQGFAAFASAYARRDLLRGREVMTSGDQGLRGTACGVAPNGALQLRTPEGQLRSVVSGEVSVRPAA